MMIQITELRRGLKAVGLVMQFCSISLLMLLASKSLLSLTHNCAVGRSNLQIKLFQRVFCQRLRKCANVDILTEAQEIFCATKLTFAWSIREEKAHTISFGLTACMLNLAIECFQYAGRHKMLE